MATMSAYTLDRRERTLFFRLNAQNVPIQLPFDLVTIDKDFQAFEPMANRISDKGLFAAGPVTGAVYLRSNLRLPIGEDPVWSYYGI